MKTSSPTDATPARPGARVRRRRTRSTEDLFAAYRTKLRKYDIPEETYDSLDLDNDFYWLFRLEELLARAYRTFEEVNRTRFANALPRPRIEYCDRSTGGFYNRTEHLIGISLAMTVEYGEPEFLETLLHEISHIAIGSHSPKFYALLRSIGGSGRKAPMTVLLQAKRTVYAEKRYPVVVACPSCRKQQRYRTRRALRYACRTCCERFAGGKFDARFKFVEVPKSEQ